MDHWNARKQRRGDTLTTATRHRQALLAPWSPIDERTQERKIICEIFQHAFEVSFQASHLRTSVARAAIAPFGELTRHDLLNGLPIREVRGTA